MRKTIIAGNWKLNKTNREAIELVTLCIRDLGDIAEIDVVVCPPFTALSDVSDLLTDSNIGLGAQNLFWEETGAYTGEVSALLLKDIGVQYVILGHSERRQYFAETDEAVNKKIRAALKHQLTPIVCIGEVLKEREENKTFDVIKKQFNRSLSDLTNQEIEKIIIAYEPIWAIGTGKTATPQQAQEVHRFIRELLTEKYNREIAETVRIQYGGSVKPDNIAELADQPDIDGALVGGASLQQGSFVAIVKNSLGAKHI